MCRSHVVALLLLLPSYLLLFFSFAPSFSLVQGLSPVQMRATLTATVMVGGELDGHAVFVGLPRAGRNALSPPEIVERLRGGRRR